MAIEAKIDFLSRTEKRLSSEVTAETMNTVLRIVADVIEGFDMRVIAVRDEQDDLLDCYMNALKVQGRSEKTMDRYKYVISRMMESVHVPTRQITVYHLRSYIADMKARGMKDSTMEGNREVISAYFNWLFRESLIEKNPVANLGAIKCEKKKKEIISRVDMEKLSGACKSVRNRAIIHVLASTGCRISELTELNRDAIHYTNDGAECVVHGKGNKYRRVYINSVAAMFLKQYLAGRTDDNEALFLGSRNERLQPNGIRVMLKALGKAAGVEHIHPHKFRRTLATNMSRHGMPIQEVANILGHDKLDTTMQYVMLDDEDIRQSYKRYA